MDPIRVGICGFGTVGSGTFRVLQRNRDEIAARVGRDVTVTHIGARRDNSQCDTGNTRVSRDVFAVVRDPEVDIVVELIGGCEVARTLVLQAIEAGKHVITANKACLLYTSDAADERSSVDLGGRRIIKKKKDSLTTRTATQ